MNQKLDTAAGGVGATSLVQGRSEGLVGAVGFEPTTSTV
jgi:hypothetical protein